VRHYTRLSQMCFGVDCGTYPLGSCTMKYNPRFDEDVAADPRLASLHPLQPEETVQGALAMMHTLEGWLAEVAGMDRVSLQPAAGAHGEFLGMLLVRAYFEDRGERRDEMVVPDSAHGTNPASAAMAGFKVVQVPSGPDGCLDPEAVRAAVGPRTAGLMLTNPNTLGLFERSIEEVVSVVHEAGGLLYYDGANLNAVMGKARPGDMGFDVMHFNLHKTFATPHGGGGAGAGPVGVKAPLVPFLPVPVVERRGGRYMLDSDRPKSIGKVHGFHGNVGVLARAYAYILTMGGDGLTRASELAVVNANYLVHLLMGAPGLELPYAPERARKHECAFSADSSKARFGCDAVDLAKRLLDLGVHAPTVNFPLIVHNALMVEPTESEPREALEEWAAALRRALADAAERPDEVHAAPRETASRRLDEVGAVRNPVLSWMMARPP
jgi:glycine dehydrogenase subunit 2